MSKLHPVAQFLICLGLLVLCVTFCVFQAFAKGGYYLSALVTFGLIVALFLGLAVWRIWNHRLGSIVYRGLFGLVALAVTPLVFPSWGNLILESVWPILRQSFPQLPMQAPAYSWVEAIPGLLFILVFCWLVLHYFRESDVTANHSGAIKSDFPEPGFKEKCLQFAGLLKDDLESRDRETNWSHAYFTPLEAEVEVQGRRKHELTDLLTALRKFQKSKAFLVLGDPGAGKSVALRQLCRKLLDEVPRSGCVPLYVNLREWTPDATWTSQNLPPVAAVIDSLHTFVKNNISERLDVFSRAFIREYFDRLLNAGRLFLILDSFDEINVLLDAPDRSPLVRLFSDALWRFLHGANNGRGILASRPFRRPTEEFQADSRLEIRPLSDSRVEKFIRRRFVKNCDQLLTTLFTKRHDLLSAARNPFTAALLLDYLDQHRNSEQSFPISRAQLYEDYIRFRVRDVIAELKSPVDENKMWHFCCFLGENMLTSSRLEIPVSEIRDPSEPERVQNLLKLLVSARLIRLGGSEQMISFTHRRFAEYFAAVTLLALPPDELPYDSIPNDSRWRDTLVIYSEICDDAQAARLATLCWAEIVPFFSDLASASKSIRFKSIRLRAIHCLRFLADAFPQRPEACASFVADLEVCLKAILDTSNDILFRKIAIEATGVITSEALSDILVGALEGDDLWIRETAFHACRRSEIVDPKFEAILSNSVCQLPPFKLLTAGSGYVYSLRLCPKLSRIWVQFKLMRVESAVYLCGVVMLFACLLLRFFVGNIDWNSKWLSELFLVLMCYFPVRNVFEQICGRAWASFLLGGSISSISGKGFPCGELPYVWTVCLVLLTTWLPSWLYKKSQIRGVDMRKRRIRWKSIALGLILLIAFVGISCGILYGMSLFLAPWQMSTLSALIWGGILYSNARRIVSDHFMLSKLGYHELAHRERIEVLFKKFQTPTGRLKFIEKLRKHKVRPTGDWTTGSTPNLGDEASSRLAQMEEKWLGLDR